MELAQLRFLEEILGLRNGISEIIPNGIIFDQFEDNPSFLTSSNPTFMELISPQITTQPIFDYPNFISDSHAPFPEIVDSSSFLPFNETSPSIIQQTQEGNCSSMAEEEKDRNFQRFEAERSDILGGFKLEMEQKSGETQMGFCVEKKNKSRKVEGQPSKNLMAERRRRKRLNDRLSMLRSIVPKISKMDRTSILGDAIDYMKELLEKINKLQEEEEGTEIRVTDQTNPKLGDSKELKPNETLVRNSPKFEVERREIETRIEICCSAKPGLLLSTVNTLEALGLEVQQCVVSCFSDFSMQASCSEGAEQRGLMSTEDIKQALFRNAGYGGRCL